MRTPRACRDAPNAHLDAPQSRLTRRAALAAASSATATPSASASAA